MKRCCLLLTATVITFAVFAQPAIQSFLPASGPAGTGVTIKGSGFDPNPAANIVFFGSVSANVAAATDTSLLVTAPAGATYQPLSVTTGHLTAYSSIPFLMTFAGNNDPFSSASFIQKTDLSAGIYPHAISIADFNNDGRNDLVVAKGSSGTVSVFPNTSTADSIYFGAKLELAASGNSHECSAVGDIDGDGKPDIAIANTWNTSSVSIFRNTSTGGSLSFAPKIDLTADNAPYSVAIGDVDGDGKPDIVIANGGSSMINVYRNTSTPGNISFASRIDYTASGSAYSVTTGDLNADGKPEIVFTTQGNNYLYVMQNSSVPGTVSFAAPQIYAPVGGPFVVAIGDLDGDGKPDVAASSMGGAIVVLRNTSSGGTISFSPAQSFATGGYTVCVAIGDLNGDGKPDLVAANRNPVNATALRNTSTPGAISFDNYVGYSAEADPFFVAVGDLNNDGRPDITVANAGAENVSILRNIIGANVVPTITSFTPTSGINGTVVTIKGANFNGVTAVRFGGTDATSFTVDSSTGITATVGTGLSGNVSVTNGYGTATLAGFVYNGPVITGFSPMIGINGTVVTINGTNFTGATAVKFGSRPAVSFTVVSATAITAIVGTGSSGSVSVTTPNGTATMPGFSYGPPVIAAVIPAMGDAGSVVSITGNSFDPTPANNTVFFGAVKANVFYASPTELKVNVPAGATYQPVSVTTNNLTALSTIPFSVTFPTDDGGLSANSFSAINSFGTGGNPCNIAIKDLNDDGKPELITANATGNSISILKNTGSIGHVVFAAKADYPSGANTQRVATGDFDGDGRPDIAVSNFNSGNASTISVFKNTSTGGAISLASKTDYASGNGTLGIAVSDMDGDGKPDIVTTSGNSGFISFFKNITVAGGAISFAARQDIPNLNHATEILLIDVDGDNKTDIVTTNFSAASISVYRNTSLGGVFSLAAAVNYATGSNPTFLSSADLNGDGKPDIAVTNYNSNVSFFINISNVGSILLSNVYNSSIKATNLAMSDLDGDGKIDHYAGKPMTGITSLFVNTFDGSLSFAPSIDFTTGNFDSYTTAGDIDGDGRPELIAANPTMNAVVVLRNKTGDPVVKSISDSTAVKGQTITITGYGFAGTTSVKFGGVEADSFIVVSSTQIDAVVNNGASGDVTVTTVSGEGSMSGFNFIPEIGTVSSTTFCHGGFAILTSTAQANNQWYKDGVLIATTTSDTLHAKASGVYTVKTTGNGITTSSPGSVQLFVTTIAPPQIAKDSLNNLISSYITGNQWYFNGNPVPGATDQTYHPDKNGNYNVTVNIDGCTSDSSETYSFVYNGIINLGNDRYVAVYPNPVSDRLKINWNFTDATVLNVTITDLSGNQLLTTNVTNGATINVSILPPGIYLLRVYSNDHMKINKSTKIIKGG